MQLLAELARGAYETIRETLPTDSREAQCFLAGMAWALAIYVLILLVTSWATITAIGR